MEELNHHEEQIMSIFWNQGELLIRDILDQLEDPKPPYTTLASTIRNIERKGYLSHRMYGTVNIYKPVISREEYSKKSINRLVGNFFGGSVGNFLSFMVKEKKISEKEIKEMKQLINQMDDSSK
ncbi:BlaI/MecI/CopY family transcriptional regulator [Algoriphagus sanaruensis]|uniref:CopY family transcriptional repressor n=1 Tax=Algoriphagus sanaruensis TaxID=1727163 RepID=A0A142ENU7_9BACT|nr:BlaI/MecI/CopY family transcriptional regulator [Algoriphagus sanaruensis]AMQ56802.1 CopY family transcriptional repressor [Algoriphagus sanaruensis]